MKYPYWKVPPLEERDPWTRRPVVRVTLTGPERSLDLTALVDSGSDYSLFHVYVAEVLGIDLSQQVRARPRYLRDHAGALARRENMAG